MSNGRKKDFPCLVCEVHVKKNDPAIQCNLCDLWVHQKCGKIGDALFKELIWQAENNGGATWSCRACRSASAKLNKQLTEVYKRVESLEAARKDQDQEIQTVKNSVTTMDKKVEAIAEKSTGMSEQVKDFVFQELKDREEKKSNVVIHNLDEAGPKITQGKERKAVDMTYLAELFDVAKVKVNMDRDIKYVRRLGESRTNNTRPLLVGFYDSNLQQSILRNARNLANTNFSEVSLCPDLTKRQRQEDTEVRKLCDQKNEARTGEDLNFLWKAVAPKGQKRAVRVREEIQEVNRSSQEGRGRGRGRPRGSGRYRPHQRERLSSEKRQRSEDEEEETVSPPAKK